MKPSTLCMFSAALIVGLTVGCRHSNHGCSQCNQGGYAPGMQGPSLSPTPADDSAPPIPQGAPRVPGVTGQLPRITLPQYAAEPAKPSFMQRVKFGLSRLNPLRKRDAEPTYDPSMNPNTMPMQPVPDSRLPNVPGPTLAPPAQARQPVLRGTRASWGRQRSNHYHYAPRASATRRVDEWPHATLPGRTGREPRSYRAIRPDVANGYEAGAQFRPARFSAQSPYASPYVASPPPARPPAGYNPYTSCQPMGYQGHAPVRNFN